MTYFIDGCSSEKFVNKMTCGNTNLEKLIPVKRSFGKLDLVKYQDSSNSITIIIRSEFALFLDSF